MFEKFHQETHWVPHNAALLACDSIINNILD
jgi:hypothetical protein